ncbi:hypothetical protein [Pleomorphomonas sp. PLEO]|uniref:hypothetical protein n=1 Tax=Pleomorphomonas sp. PLEO TaxID=3239306 RepID=UPI00351EAEDE
MIQDAIADIDDFLGQAAGALEAECRILFKEQQCASGLGLKEVDLLGGDERRVADGYRFQAFDLGGDVALYLVGVLRIALHEQPCGQFEEIGLQGQHGRGRFLSTGNGFDGPLLHCHRSQSTLDHADRETHQNEQHTDTDGRA